MKLFTRLLFIAPKHLVYSYVVAVIDVENQLLNR